MNIYQVIFVWFTLPIYPMAMPRLANDPLCCRDSIEQFLLSNNSLDEPVHFERKIAIPVLFMIVRYDQYQDLVQKWLQKRPRPILSKAPFGFSNNIVMHAAISEKNLPLIIDYCIRAKRKQLVLGDNLDTPLHVAAQYHTIKNMKLLLHHGADANKRNFKTCEHPLTRFLTNAQRLPESDLCQGIALLLLYGSECDARDWHLLKTLPEKQKNIIKSIALDCKNWAEHKTHKKILNDEIECILGGQIIILPAHCLQKTMHPEQFYLLTKEY